MWPFNIFKKRPFTHNPEDFRLRIVPAWFSNEWVEFEYSGNGGETWKRVHGANKPYLDHVDYDWKWEPVHYQLGDGDFDHEKKKFSSYQKILDFEEKELIEYYKGVESQNQRRIENKQKKKEAYIRANK